MHIFVMSERVRRIYSRWINFGIQTILTFELATLRARPSAVVNSPRQKPTLGHFLLLKVVGPSPQAILLFLAIALLLIYLLLS